MAIKHRIKIKGKIPTDLETAKEEADQKKDMAKQAMVSQQQIQSQQLAAQTAMQKINAETEAKMKYRQADITFEIEKQQAEAALKSQLMQQEFEYNLQLQGLTQSQITAREDEKEKAKSDRISQQNTQQSELINQRKNNLPPKNFESNEDTLDGFDLAEFEPR